MDQNSPDHYIETTQDSIARTEEFIQHVLTTVNNPLITPVVTPR
jgi:guanine deaminase